MANAKNSWLSKVNPNLIIWAVGIYAGYNYIVSPALEALHLKKSNAQLQNESAATNAGNPWASSFYKTAPAGSMLLTVETARNLAETLYQYPGIFFDSFNTVLGVFQQLKTKSQLSFLCDVFQQQYNLSLYGYMQDGGGVFFWDGLSNDNLSTINQLVNNLPNYKA